MASRDVLIGHPNTNPYVNEALLSANWSTAFPEMRVQIILLPAMGFACHQQLRDVFLEVVSR